MTLRMTPQAAAAHQARVNGQQRAATGESGQQRAKKTGVRSSDYEGWLFNQMEAAGLPKPARQFRWLDDRQYAADLAIPPLLIEIDGAAHRIKGRFLDDILKNQAAIHNGYYLLRVATSQVRNGEAVGIIKQALERIRAYGPTFDAGGAK